ncbi:alpha/beta hydrolase family protein [mine drainage metagenome]|uniref:Alpha/beta hydrolase family protein n=1 Tax=mine drainage metagenome TaxID=410659 RepID=A0A1J5S036_9ZZZZ
MLNAMSASTAFSPVKTLMTSLDYLHRPARLRVLLRTAGQRFNPPRPPEIYEPAVTRRQDGLLASGAAQPHERATLHRIFRRGPNPTIVLGGFVPDSTESVYLIKDLLLRHGSVYCVNYPRTGFNAELLFAQLDDLVDEIAQYHHRVPTFFSVSYGCGLVFEWLRRRRLAGGERSIGGLVFVSPVVCTDDLLPRGAKKASTLLGRAIAPFMAGDAPPDERAIEKARALFAKMFEAGAQNREALKSVMNADEAIELRDRVLGTIRSITQGGACERVRSLQSMSSPIDYFNPATLPLSGAPTLILYAEKEDSVLDPGSPTRFVLESAHQAYFPRSRCAVVSNPKGAAVQHASLIFHHENFRPALHAFYGRIRTGQLSAA